MKKQLIFASLVLLATACNKSEPPQAAPSAAPPPAPVASASAAPEPVASAAPAPADTPSAAAPVAPTAAPAVAVKAVSTPADFEATAESAITASNASQVLTALEKEIGQ
jgi:hypothetical protein